MATASSSQVNSTCPYVSLDVTSSSSTGGSATYAWTLKYVTSGYTLSTSQTKLVTAKVGSTTVYNSYITVGGKSSYTISSGTVTLSKTTSSQTITVSVSIAWGSATWSGTTMGTRSGSTTFTLAAKTSYTITYNANGGSGAPSSQTKWYGTTLTLSSTKPTRSYYTFSKWNTASGGGGTSYSSGGSYTANAAATLYAIWTGNTYTIAYNANGGSNAPASTTKKYGSTGTITTAVPTRTNYNFLGWATSSDSTTVTYKSGATLSATSITANTTLYAVWELAHTAPTISGLSAFRCDSSGNALNTGSYASVSFSWVTYDGYTASSLTVTGSSSTSITVSDTSGSVLNKIIAVSANETTITVTLTDSAGTSASATFKLAAAYTFLFGFTEDGTGAAIGKLPEKPNYLEINFTPYAYSNFYYLNSSNVGSGDTYFRAKSWSGAQINFGVGSGGSNRGIYDTVASSWMIYRDSSNQSYFGSTSYKTYLRGSSIEVTGSTTFNNIVYFPNYGIAIANNYGVHHYLASGSSYAKFEWLNTSNEFNLGNTSYNTRIYGSSHIYMRTNGVVFAPMTSFSTSNTGRSFQFQINASETVADSETSTNAILCGGCDSSSPFIRSYATYARTYSSLSGYEVVVTATGTFGRYNSSSARYKHDINYFDNAGYASEDGLAKRTYTIDEDAYRADYRSILHLPVVQHQYNDGYITGEPDYDYSKYTTNFIAEDVAKICPAAAVYNADGEVESWDVKQLIPRIVAVLQEHERRLTAKEAS